jgi:hypothetical protein
LIGGGTSALVTGGTGVVFGCTGSIVIQLAKDKGGKWKGTATAIEWSTGVAQVSRATAKGLGSEVPSLIKLLFKERDIYVTYKTAKGMKAV